jgi:hypothetical protein
MHVAQRERDAEQRQRQREDAVRGGTTPIRIVVQEPAEREAQMEREAEQRRALMEQRTREAERRDEKIRGAGRWPGHLHGQSRDQRSGGRSLPRHGSSGHPGESAWR